MDDAEKMLLKDIQSDIQTLNKNTLYLCRHTACADQQLKSIEENLNKNNVDLSTFQKRISQIEGKIMAGSALLAVIVSCVMSVLV